MEATILEWLNLLVRWVHVIAAIMWIGDSFLFMWMDSHLTKPTREREGAVVGELWMVHSGGFYELVKRKSLMQSEIPPQLYWFKWESYTTWISGFLLLVVVYYLGGAAYLVDKAVLDVSAAGAVGISLSILVGAVLIYDTIWRTLGQSNAGAARLVSWVLLAGAVILTTRIFPGRAAFLHVGAMIGTVMASNVFFRIIPAQKYMLAQTHAGQPVDTTYGMRAKQRSTHNHYLTLPVLFTMLSNHFPTTYSHKWNWLVLLLLMVFGASLKYFMNFRTSGNNVVLGLGGVSLLSVIGLTVAPVAGGPSAAAYEGKPKVTFARAAEIITNRCVSCHAQQPANPAFPQPPNGIMLDTPDRIAALKDRILTRAVLTRTMPLGNMTGMLDAERDELGAWVAQGGNTEGATAMPQNVATQVAPVAKAFASPEEEARDVFGTRCATCHGTTGKGDGAAAVALNPKPRNFTDHAWQASVTDEQLKKVIGEGGEAVGKSNLMLANPDLVKKPDVLNAVVKLIRALDAPP